MEEKFAAAYKAMLAHDYVNALYFYTMIEKENKMDGYSYYNSALIYIRLNKYSEAERYLKKADEYFLQESYTVTKEKENTLVHNSMYCQLVMIRNAENEDEFPICSDTAKVWDYNSYLTKKLLLKCYKATGKEEKAAMILKEIKDTFGEDL